MSMTADDLRQKVELAVVELIKDKLAEGTMTEARAQQASQTVLDTLKPGMTLEELYRAIPKLDDTVPELSSIILPLLRQYENNVVKPIEKKVQDLIRTGQYDAAADLAKKAISADVKLVWTASAKPPQSKETT